MHQARSVWLFAEPSGSSAHKNAKATPTANKAVLARVVSVYAAMTLSAHKVQPATTTSAQTLDFASSKVRYSNAPTIRPVSPLPKEVIASLPAHKVLDGPGNRATLLYPVKMAWNASLSVDTQVYVESCAATPAFVGWAVDASRDTVCV